MEWSRRRRGFDHDWLKNQFLTALAHMDECRPRTSGRSVVRGPFLPATTAPVAEQKKRTTGAGNNFRRRDEPACFFDLIRWLWSAGMQEPWVVGMIDALWRARTQPDRLQARLQDAVKKCDSAWESFSHSAPDADGCFDIEALGVMRGSSHPQYFLNFQQQSLSYERSEPTSAHSCDRRSVREVGLREYQHRTPQPVRVICC